jgi:phospholipid/cholesterol/gamma-HCH transport system permease protein
MDGRNDKMAPGESVSFSMPAGGVLLVHLEGVWKTGQGTPSVHEAMREALAVPGLRRVAFESSGLRAWDTSLPVFLEGLRSRAAEYGMDIDLAGLPGGVVRLLKISSESGELQGLLEVKERLSFLGSVGRATLALGHSAGAMLVFTGEAFLALLRFLGGRARYRRSDLTLFVYESGMQALPIVSLISLLVGLILGFVGIVQLRKFGTEIFIADLVGITMAREMGAMMTAMIMTGRTGAAYATQLGTMETGEEVDAFKTLGLSPMEFLVVPRILALIFMMPLLCIYADLTGILGGGLVGVGMFGIPFAQYYAQTVDALSLADFLIGVVKSAFFALLIALAGCYYGMRSNRSAEAVGYAATRSVVSGIVLIVVADGIFAVITTVLGL